MKLFTIKTAIGALLFTTSVTANAGAAKRDLNTNQAPSVPEAPASMQGLGDTSSEGANSEKNLRFIKTARSILERQLEESRSGGATGEKKKAGSILERQLEEGTIARERDD